MDFLFNLVPDNVRNAAILAVARHIGSSIAGAALVWLLAHHASQSNAIDISQGVAALIVALTSYGCSLLDVKNVDTKIKVAEATPVPVSSPTLESPTSIQKSDKPNTTTSKQPESPFVPVLNKQNHPFENIP